MPADDPLWPVLHANFPDLAWPAEVVRQLPALVPLRRLATGRSVFVQGQRPAAFYAVARGEIEARFTGVDGRVSALEHLGPPRLFGLAAFAAGLPSEYEAVAHRPSELLVIGHGAYRLLMDEVPGFARALLAEFARRFDGTLQLLQAARHEAAADRFSAALVQLARQRGRPATPGWLEVPATQAELARLAHVSRQTANELLAAAEAAGRVRRGRGRWWWRAS